MSDSERKRTGMSVDEAVVTQARRTENELQVRRACCQRSAGFSCTEHVDPFQYRRAGIGVQERMRLSVDETGCFGSCVRCSKSRSHEAPGPARVRQRLFTLNSVHYTAPAAAQVCRSDANLFLVA